MTLKSLISLLTLAFPLWLVPSAHGNWDFNTDGRYEFGFEETDDFTGVLIVDNNNDGFTWGVDPDPDNAFEGVRSGREDGNPNMSSDDWLYEI